MESRAKPRGGPVTLIGLACTFAALWFACAPAGAQLPALPRADPAPLPEPVPQAAEPVQQAVQQPLPAPVEEVVQDSPVAPVRDQVRGVVGGGSAGGSDAGGGTSGATAGAGSGSGSGSTAEVPGGSDGSGDGTPTSRSGERGPARGGAGAGGADSPVSEPAAADRSGAGDDSRGRARGGVGEAANEQGRLARTVERIVEVVPGLVWIALGVLAVLALALGARALVERRRARALEGERQRLLRDMGLLERVLLPQVPERLGSLAASVAYRPAAGPAAGGDFYDVLELAEGRVALVVGDVSGHGREALERTNALRPGLRAHLEAGLSPRAALAQAARAAGVDPSGGFTTVAAAVHDPAAGTLTYALAGHPPPVLTGPGHHEPLTAVSSPPVGVGLSTGVRQTTVPFPRGSTACFFTDGLLEARRGGKLLGHEEVSALIAELGPFDSAEVVLDRVVERADETQDDMTACIVRAVAGSGAVSARVEEFELGPDDLGTPVPERFLEACGLAGSAAAAALAEAERVLATDGTAVLAVTIDGGAVTASATAPTSAALATT